MKNLQKGFAIPLIIVIIAVLVIGGGVFFIYKQNKQQAVSLNLPLEGTASDSWSVAERQQYYDALLKLDPNTVFTLWKQFEEKKDDPRRQGFVGIALSDTLKVSPDDINAPVYKNISVFLSDEKNKTGSKSYLLSILGGSVSVSSMRILLDQLDNQIIPDILINVRQAIINMSNNRVSARFHEELSPILEDAYQKSTDDKNRSTFAIALAKIGAPSGITLLVKEAIKIGSGNLNFVHYALLETRNPNAIPILVKGLNGRVENNFELLLSGETLAAMGSSDATEAIIEWAKGADSDIAPLVKSWLLKMRDTASIKAVRYIVENNETFKSVVVKKAVQDALNILDSQSAPVKKLIKGVDY